MKLPAYCIVFSLLLMSCSASVKYVHPTKDPDDFEQDKYECIRVANEYASKVSSKDNIFLITNQTEQCLEKRGWIKKVK